MKIDLKALILKEHSKHNALFLSAYVSAHPDALKEYMNILFGDDVKLAQRAAWSLSDIARDESRRLQRYFPKMISVLEEGAAHPAIERNILHSFERMDIPEKYQSALIDICFAIMLSEEKSIAARAYSITLAARLCAPYPELVQEFAVLVKELQSRPLSAGIKVRLRNAIRDLKISGI